MQRPSESSEQFSEMLDPHRKEEREGAAIEIAGRLAQKGIEITAGEDPALLADLLSAAERFEDAVIKNGGDLMINMPGTSEPQDPAFVIPQRSADESPTAYIARINDAAANLEAGRQT